MWSAVWVTPTVCFQASHADWLLACRRVTPTMCWHACHADRVLTGMSRRPCAGRHVTPTVCWQACHADCVLACHADRVLADMSHRPSTLLLPPVFNLHVYTVHNVKEFGRVTVTVRTGFYVFFSCWTRARFHLPVLYCITVHCSQSYTV